MPREVHVARYMSRERDVILARAIFTPLFEDYLKHATRWLGEPDGLAAIMMQQGLAAAGLYLTTRPRDESTAWTINLAEPPLNIFLTADAAANKVVGRHFLENVSTEDHSRIFVQTVRHGGKPHLSFMPVKGFDLLEIFEQYYAQSEQNSTRFFMPAEDEFLMITALPDADDAWLLDLTCEDAVRLTAAPDVYQIEIRPVVFACTCDLRRISRVVWDIFKGDTEEFFGSDREVGARCPRCGRSYMITRDDFLAASRRAGPD